MKKFTDESTLEITTYLQETLEKEQKVSFSVLNPDNYENRSIGEVVDGYIFRSYKSWTDLAELLFCKLLTPTIINDKEVQLTFKKLDSETSFHKQKNLREEKYGKNSLFYKIDKKQDPSFLFHYKRALESVDITNRSTVLNLGVNRGDEFEVINDLVDNYSEKQFVGVDFCPSAIKEAKEKFDEVNHCFYQENINNLESLKLEKADLIISIGTLQSPGIDFKKTFMYMYQNLLDESGAMILGFPNCRWIDGEAIFGAKAPNYPYPEMTLLLKDLHFCKKYLQQKKYRVTLTGKNYIFLTATKIGNKN